MASKLTNAAARRIDVRLAVVCYGGVSLAVYMFGTICEFRSLLTAARAFDALCEGRDPGLVSGTALIYYNLLRDIREHHGIELHVILDFVSGTSAGGINGVALATSARHGTPLQPLQNTWLDSADARVLQNVKWPTLKSLSTPSLKTYGVAAGTWLHYASTFFSTKYIKQAFSSSSGVKDLPGWFKEYAVSALSSKYPIFNGNKFLQLLQERVQQLIGEEGSNSKDKKSNAGVLRDTDSLSLFVTMTDLNPFHRNIATGLHQGKESMHVNVLRFDYQKGGVVDDFQDDRKLSFAARATSAFPFAFQGIQIAQMFSDDQAREFISNHFRDIQLDNTFDNAPRRQPETQSWGEYFKSFVRSPPPDMAFSHLPLQNHEFADGGLIMNKPFVPILRALKGRRKTLGNNIQRRVVYLEPSPEPVRHKKMEWTPVQEILHEEEQGLRVGDTRIESPEDGLDIFGEDVLKTFGPYAESLKKRNLDLEKAGASPRVEVVGVYDHLAHGGRVVDAVTSQPISDQIREVDSFNSQLRDLHEFMLRQYVHTCLVAPDLIPTGLDRDRQVTLSDFCCGVPEHLVKVHMETRANDTFRSLAEALAGRRWFYLPDQTLQRSTLLEMMDRLGNKALPVVKSPFFFRDCLTALVCVLENHSMNPTVFTVNDEQRIRRAQAVSHQIQLVIFKFDEMISGRDAQGEAVKDLAEFKETKVFFDSDFHVITTTEANGTKTRQMNVTEEELRNVLRKCSIENGQFVQTTPPQDLIDKLNKAARFAFGRLTDWMTWTENEIIRNLIPWVLNETRSDALLFKLVKETIFSFGYFDALTFPVVSRASLGDNAVTKVTRVSPDNMKMLFSKTREGIKRKGLTSIASVFVRSNDAAHFGGFFFEDARESDLIWGRLDGVEAVCNLLIDCANEEDKKAANDYRVLMDDYVRHAGRATQKDVDTPFKPIKRSFEESSESNKEESKKEENINGKMRERARRFLEEAAKHQRFPENGNHQISPGNHRDFYYQGFAKVLEEEINARDPNKRKSQPKSGSEQDSAPLKWKSEYNKKFFETLLTKHPRINEVKQSLAHAADGHSHL